MCNNNNNNNNNNNIKNIINKYIPDKHNKIVQTIAEANLRGGGGGGHGPRPT